MRTASCRNGSGLNLGNLGKRSFLGCSSNYGGFVFNPPSVGCPKEQKRTFIGPVFTLFFGGNPGEQSTLSKDMPFAKKIDRVSQELLDDELLGLSGQSMYRTDPEFNPTSLKFHFDGVDGEFREEVRNFIKNNPKVFLLNNDGATSGSASSVALDRNQIHLQTLSKLRHLGKKQFISVAQTNTRPREMFSMFEVLASLDIGLAVAAHAHWTMFGSIIRLYGESETHHKWVLEDIDEVKSLGCVLSGELGSETAPYLTSATFSTGKRCFVLNSGKHPIANKFAVVNGANARWGIVLANLKSPGASTGEDRALTPNAQGYIDPTTGRPIPPQLFLIKLRDNNGQLMPGIQFQDLGPTAGFDGAGMGVFRFTECEIPYESLIATSHKISVDGEVSPISADRRKTVGDPLSDLAKFQRLGSAAMAIGMLKRLSTEMTHYLTSRVAVSGSNERNFPFLSFRRNQEQFAKCFSATAVMFSLFQEATSPFFDFPHKEKTIIDHLHLILVLNKSTQLCEQWSRLSSDLMGHHHYVTTNMAMHASAFSSHAYAMEGWDRFHLSRQLADVISDLDESDVVSSSNAFASNMTPAIITKPRPVDKFLYRSPHFFRRVYSHLVWLNIIKIPDSRTRGEVRGEEFAGVSPFLSFFESQIYVHRKFFQDNLPAERAYGAQESFLFLHTFCHEETKGLVENYWSHWACSTFDRISSHLSDIENRKSLSDLGQNFAINEILEREAFGLATSYFSLSGHDTCVRRKELTAEIVCGQAHAFAECFSLPKEFLLGPIGKPLHESYGLGAVPVVYKRETEFERSQGSQQGWRGFAEDDDDEPDH